MCAVKCRLEKKNVLSYNSRKRLAAFRKNYFYNGFYEAVPCESFTNAWKYMSRWRDRCRWSFWMKFWDSLKAHLTVMKMLVDCYLLSGIKLCTQCVTNKNWATCSFQRRSLGGLTANSAPLPSTLMKNNQNYCGLIPEFWKFNARQLFEPPT